MARNKKQNDKNLTLTGHLDELRKRIIASAVFFIIAATICFTFAERIIRHMVDVGRNIEFIFISPSELLMANVRIAMIGGLIVSAPFLITQIWLFVSPGLTSKERSLIASAIGMGGIFFVLGVAFSYFMVIPTMLVFFMGFQLDVIQPMISFSSYLAFILSTVVAFGIIFELPIIMILLTRFGIVKVEFFKKNRKYIILAIFAVAAVITPPDVISQLLMALPMIALTEVGIILSSLLTRKIKQ
jgi:sec-independent protein translocase protein TatC